MTPEGPYPAQTCAERKEALYQDIISLFDQGKVSETMHVCRLDSRNAQALCTAEPHLWALTALGQQRFGVVVFLPSCQSVCHNGLQYVRTYNRCVHFDILW